MAYRQAQRLQPDDGSAWNQLALVETARAEPNQLQLVYCYIRA